MNTIYVEKRNCYSYPDEKNKFAPSVSYPEYRWDDISTENNIIYDMVRNAFYGYGLDTLHFGTKEWNPLGVIIKKGDTVLVKPNWVLHFNENIKGGLDCLFTNTAIIRAIADYVAIALDGTGRLIIADSPMPDCDFEIFMKRAHIDILMESCKARGINAEIYDLRGSKVKTFSKKKIDVVQADGIEIDLGSASFFGNQDIPENAYRYSFLDANRMNEYYHTGEHNRYTLNKLVIEADVIINLPKIKTHRKAGYTAALKNYIGTCYRKDSIPHFVKGNKKKGGDEFSGPALIFETESNIRDKENQLENEQKVIRGLFLKTLRIPFWAFRHLFGSKYQGVGNWHGNDTIWRAVLDINNIVYYCDKSGILRKTPQKKFFIMGDMVVAGQGNGPLSPFPKKCGMIVCGEDPVAFDKVIVELMGFNREEIPLMNGLGYEGKWVLPNDSDESILVLSSDKDINGISLATLRKTAFDNFKPADGWECLRKKGKTK